MNEQGAAFAPVTGKQCERVEELFGDGTKYFWILVDSATQRNMMANTFINLSQKFTRIRNHSIT